MKDTINEILVGGKGILAADESTPTITKRFDVVMPGAEQWSTEEDRHEYRRTLFSTEGLKNYIGGVILFDETIRNEETIKPLRDEGILLGIKVDKGVTQYDWEGMTTQGLDGLSDRLKDYCKLGASFAKWRAVIYPNSSLECIKENAHVLGRYAKICQDHNVVPIVEPEVIMEGSHDIETSQKVTEEALHYTFDALYHEGVSLENIILKPNMALFGYDFDERFSESDTSPSPEVIAKRTLESLLRTVPAAVPIVAFLSGGQPDGQAVENLNHMNLLKDEMKAPWKLTFSFGRELQGGALKLWAKANRFRRQALRPTISALQECTVASQRWLLKRAQECSQATLGRCDKNGKEK